MFNYNGEVCPYCGRQFEDGDDIVVCPDCGAPHHRSCFAEHGMCAHAAEHGDYEWKPTQVIEEKNDDMIYCNNCGRGNLQGSVFCSFCGSPISADQNPQIYVPQSVAFEQSLGDSLYGHSVEEWKAYIGQNSYYYLYHMSRQEKTGNRVGFTVSAAFFPVVYFLYRRVWWAAAVTGILNFILSIPGVIAVLLYDYGFSFGLTLGTLETIASVAHVVSFIIALASGFFAIALFRRSAVKHMNKLKASSGSDEEYRQRLAAKGGPCSKALYIIFGITAASLLVASLFGPF